ncbi:MAG TPA: [FeFe] hydrogenase H-cluster radical SAM maturase HydG [Clostridiales bacterium UBA8960]|nr:[FeFe] hydrogenase H-cluster radical SAM maturase HydG [Clostridiales bacterium UBA8960]
MAKYGDNNYKEANFINHALIEEILMKTQNASDAEINAIIEKAKHKRGLELDEIAVLLQANTEAQLAKIYKIASEIKNAIYGNRVVLFAPLYVSNYCVNNCVYCGYKRENEFPRRKLSEEEIRQEVRILESMGHKRLALEAGEDPVNCTIDYILDTLRIIYDEASEKSNIRRVNVNIASTTIENYKKLKDADIGTYILFQETYHKPTYLEMHPKSLKGNYEYHLTAFDRAMQAGVDDVGAGVLFGLADHRFEVLSLMLHNQHLEQQYGVGFHTISVPRIKKAEGMDLVDFKHIIDDETFKKVVAILRIAVPYTGLILSTRESKEIRKELLHYGVSQISAGSCTGVGGYKENETGAKEVAQFKVSDERSPMEVIKGLIEDGFIPSYCTSCYRMGRTGDRFMALAKSGQIQHVCQPNALMTLKEYALDFGDEGFNKQVDGFIETQIAKIQDQKTKERVISGIVDLNNGARDIFL